MIPGTKSFLKKVLEADYNTSVEVKEPPKPNSLNMFLQFRKAMLNSAQVYKNLPPQEGLHDPDPQDERNRILEEKAAAIRTNSDFRLLDADNDAEAAKRGTPTSLDEEDEVMDVFEKQLVKRSGEIYTQKSNDMYEGGFELVGKF